MNYYVETNFYNHDGLVTSGGKGRDDYFEMLRRCGLERIVIPTLKTKDEVSKAERVMFEITLAAAWHKALLGLGKDDVLFVHQPPSEKFMSLARELDRVKRRGCRIVVIVFDLEEYLKPYYGKGGRIKYKASLMTEKAVLDIADVVMVHNDRMKETVAAMGIDPDCIVSVGIMDYLRDEGVNRKDIGERIRKDLPVSFCGNLIPEKAAFLSSVPNDLEINLYGPGYQGTGKQNIHYKGIYPSLEIMDAISGSFGLVWDGDSSETPKGAVGRYLLINNPHKIALYLASEMPVIVWDRSAMADFVRDEKCGFTINGLSDISDRIAGLSDEDYEQMRNNAMRIGAEMRKGSHLRAAMEKALILAGGQ